MFSTVSCESLLFWFISGKYVAGLRYESENILRTISVRKLQMNIFVFFGDTFSL